MYMHAQMFFEDDFAWYIIYVQNCTLCCTISGEACGRWGFATFVSGQRIRAVSWVGCVVRSFGLLVAGHWDHSGAPSLSKRRPGFS